MILMTYNDDVFIIKIKFKLDLFLFIIIIFFVKNNLCKVNSINKYY